MSPALPISIVMPTFDRASVLGRAIWSVLTQTFRDSGLIVVVDGSTDETRAMVETIFTDPRIRYLRQENQGVSAARNLGTENARGEVVTFLDDDELAPPGHLDRITQHFDADPELDGVGGPYHDYDDGEPGPRTCEQCSLAAHAMPFHRPTRVERLFGGNMTLRRETFAVVGPFDEEISRQGSARGDEAEWFDRARGELRLVYDPELWIWHRRDLFDLRTLVRHSFMQGYSAPEISQRRGAGYRPRPLRLLRGLGHAARRRCAQGLVVAARELGAWVGWWRQLTRSEGRRALSGSRTR